MKQFNYRRLSILQDLLKQNLPTTVDLLAKELDCSVRTLREDIKAVDDWLRENKFPSLQRKAGMGILLVADENVRAEINKEIRKINISYYEFNRSERVTFILLHLLTKQGPQTVKKFSDLFYVSRGTIFEDLKLVEDYLKNYQLVLMRQKKVGLWVDGDEIHFRRSLTTLCKDLNPVLIQMVAEGQSEGPLFNRNIEFSSSLQHVVDDLQVKDIQAIIDPILQLLDIPLSDDGRMALYLHIGMVLNRLETKNSIELFEKELEQIFTQREYQIALLVTKQLEEHFHINIPDHEIAYITLYLIGNQNAPVLPDQPFMFEDTELYQQILKMTLVMERVLHTKYNKKDQLIKGLLLHMRPAIYRARYGLHVENPLVQELKQQFKEVYEAVQTAVSTIEEAYKISFSEEEIAYITMHYGSALSNSEINDQQKLKILIICSSGIGTANLLKMQINKLFSNIEIVQTISYQMFNERNDWEANLIVSTIKVKSASIPVLTVSPLLPKEDIKKLSFYAQPKKELNVTSEQIYEVIWPIINEHSDVRDPKQLTDQLIIRLKEVFEEEKTYSPVSMGSLDDVLNLSNIQLNVKVKDWKDAICVGTKPLEKEGNVPPRYKDEIITIIQERGPYMAVAPGIMLAHGSANDEVKKVSLSFTRLNPPIKFGHESNDPISFLFVFASPNQTSHVPALQQLLEKLLDDKSRQALEVAKEPWDVIKIFIKQVEEEVYL